jgi:hypothetical protein
MDFKIGYYYLTISGQLKFKKMDDVKDPIMLFDDPFVSRWWLVERETAYVDMIIDVEHSVYNDIANRKVRQAGAD